MRNGIADLMGTRDVKSALIDFARHVIGHLISSNVCTFAIYEGIPAFHNYSLFQTVQLTVTRWSTNQSS
jgi:hypothetical protein